MARATMTDLIEEVRSLLHTPSSDPSFSDDDVQRALDQNRIEIRYQPIYGLQSISPGGAVTYGTFDIGRGWDSSVVFVDSGYNVVTPDAGQSDPSNGRFVFTPPVDNGYLLISGFNYDVYGAGADLCDTWISQNKGMYSFTRGSRSYQRGQIVSAISSLRNNLRMKQRIGSGTMIRTDII